jgi:DMSO/TMAO reductase YedYZ molybdopterin-dependent catalytic subunit
MGKLERLITEVYADDPERADRVVFGRRSEATRRGFLTGLAAMSAAIGANIPFARHMPRGLLPAALAQEAKADPAPAPAPHGRPRLSFPGKDGNLVLLQEYPLVAETPEQLLDDDTTPTSKFFVRNNGEIPEAVADADAWKLTIDGEVGRPLEIALGELKRRRGSKTLRMVLECAGNGRAFFAPSTSGAQWTNGGVGCAEWTGIALAELLRAAGPKPSAVYTAHYGTDLGRPGDPTAVALSRGVPIRKALEPASMLVWAMNGSPLEKIHGAPLRLIIPGWPGSVSHKWLSKITVRDKVHDGPDMDGTAYRIPSKPMVPGGRADAGDFTILEAMPVRAIITHPGNGTRFPAGTRELQLRGAAWAGELEVERVDVSLDFGASWRRTKLARPRNRYDWRRWSGSVPLPSDGYYELWARATDASGKMQPHIAGGWNPQGYGANPMHRIAVFVG